MEIEKTINQNVLARRSPGWNIQYVAPVPVPGDLPYAPGAQAWVVCVMRKRNELTPEIEEPEWLKGCDLETHHLYYQHLYEEMGEAALTSYLVEMDLVIASGDQRISVYSTRPEEAKPDSAMSGYLLPFIVEFPEHLEESEQG